MKFVRFQADGQDRLGLFHEGRFLDLERGRAALARSGRTAFGAKPAIRGGLQHLLRRLDWRFDELRALADEVCNVVDRHGEWPDGGPDRVLFREDEVRYRNPFPEHNRIITCRGLNPATLRTQNCWELPSFPTADLRTRYRLIGHQEPCVLDPDPPHRVGGQPPKRYWNPELAALIVCRGRDIPRADAGRFLGGFTLFIDGCVHPILPTLLHRSGLPFEGLAPHWIEGTYGVWGMDHPIGPWVVSADEVPDPYDVKAVVIDSGTVVDIGSSLSLIFSFEEAVHFFSRFMTLEPGDLITSSAIGWDGLPLLQDYASVPHPYIEVRCERIGDLCCPIVDRRREPPR